MGQLTGYAGRIEHSFPTRRSSDLRICRAYLRKHRTDTVDIDELAEELPADEPAPSLEKIIHEALDEDEAKLFIEYTYADAEERMRISQRLGISKNAMYLRIKRIRAKIIEYLS